MSADTSTFIDKLKYMEYTLRTEHPDLLSTQTLMTPNGYRTHSVIKFDLYLQRKFPDKDYFINQDAFADLYQKMINKFNNGIKNNNESYFNSSGTLEKITIDSLKFYQKEVGIDGPKHSDINDPVFIIKTNSDFILYNGYHRLLSKIESQEKDIQGFILSIDN
ncbi:hypothetical protein [Halpernia sp. GG3]